jgi:hypothetical protein
MMRCIECGKEITVIDNLLKLFWAPVSCNTSFVWRFVCSQKCQRAALTKGLENPDELAKKIMDAVIEKDGWTT